jgi:predicted homoserine dehydrogenase-like protein
MFLHRRLLARERSQRPIRVGVIGAGKFSTMFLHQARRTPAMRVEAICDLDRGRAMRALQTAGWSTADAVDGIPHPGQVRVLAGAGELLAQDGLEVVVEATGDPKAGIVHALEAFSRGLHVVMVNVEADALAGPLLAAEARRLGVVYTLAYGDQPALVAELVDWARTSGFEVVCAGKGTKYLPAYHASTPETVWQHYGISPQAAAAGGMNAKMFNSFLDGTKSAIEMAAVANACALEAPENGLSFPPCGVDDLAALLVPREQGGLLAAAGTVEVVSSLKRDGSALQRDLRWGVFVVFAGDGEYARRCFREYGLSTDPSGRYSALYRPCHLIGLELGTSVASAVLDGEDTGSAREFRADVVAVAKRDLARGEILDGEGGATVWGRLAPAARSVSQRALPLGLASGVRLKRDIARGAVLTRADVDLDDDDPVVALRATLERTLSAAGGDRRGGARAVGA